MSGRALGHGCDRRQSGSPMRHGRAPAAARPRGLWRLCTGAAPVELLRPHPARRETSVAAAREELSASNADSGWVTPDPATAIQTVTGPGVDALRFRGESHEQGREPVITPTRGPGTSPARQRQRNQLRNSKTDRRGGFHSASMRPDLELLGEPAALGSRGLAGTFQVEPAGIEPATSCLQSRRSPN